MAARPRLLKGEGRYVPGFFVHGYEERVAAPGSCDRCECPLKSAYDVSYSGLRATHRLCPRCLSFLRAAYGSMFRPLAEGDAGRTANRGKEVG